ncbi:ATP synthase subunit B [Streptococcus urinalis FB127-CNA-2]|uniref:ATP synthase subunit b n=1 Tax=Streptococcus urinalis 2285-97 TaxID=764291 RepID=G5KF08_9STRE|nr:F0F1 ATP synthase subunit B [Streptococcus urinalis]EHJ57736.1 ATP synthase F0, B subunit [Streptococcus urinalis 2285-97]EKS21975.1 ATP synthase subunit B [Streptococcus urinalis FB127-CNA-2]VEF31787.1 ATP synthase B chain [Streptococcus urinalis]
MSLLINSSSLGNIIIVTGSFILLLVLIKVFAWEQMTGIFAARETKIASDIDNAEKARKSAEDLEAKRQVELSSAKDEANQIIDNAKQIGQAKGDQMITDAKDEIGRLKAKANQDIEQSKTEALSSVKGEVADLTVLLAEKIMSTNLDKEAQSNLIDNYIDKLGEA